MTIMYGQDRHKYTLYLKQKHTKVSFCQENSNKITKRRETRLPLEAKIGIAMPLNG